MGRERCFGESIKYYAAQSDCEAGGRNGLRCRPDDSRGNKAGICTGKRRKRSERLHRRGVWIMGRSQTLLWWYSQRKRIWSYKREEDYSETETTVVSLLDFHGKERVVNRRGHLLKRKVPHKREAGKGRARGRA